MGGSKASGVSAKEPDRGQWDRPIEFFLACVGYAVGVGNVWRFPYLCYRNGGGAFLIPYTISLLIAGIPIFYLELSLGQFSSLGPIGLFERLSPIFEGIGWGMVVVTFITAAFYNMLLAWILYYLAISFRKTLLWSTCRNDWNTYLCHSNLETAACVEEHGEGWDFFNKTCRNASELLLINATYFEELAGNRTSPAEEFFELEVLNISEGFNQMGGLQWKLVLCLFSAWLLVLLCLIKGVKSTGKVVYFTATFPYVVLIILMIRGLTLDGAMDGIRYYIVPDFNKLKQISVWKDAAVQIFFSLSAAFGGLLTMASYNKFHNNCFRDAILVSVINCGTSFFAGFAVFSIAGFMAHDLGLDVKNVVRDGIGLAFIAYPEAISRMPVSPLWAVLFFFMLLTLGLDSMMVFVETVTTGIQDQFPFLMRHKLLLLTATCTVGFLCGLPICSRAGIYVFTLLNDMAAGYSVLLLAIFELIAACWFYGIRNMFLDIQMMLGASSRNPIAKIIGPTGIYWAIVWIVICPMFLTAIVVLIFAFYETSYYGDYPFPLSAEIAGWIVSLLSIGLVPLFAIYRLIECCCKGKPIRTLFKATIEWCPADQREQKKAEKEEEDRKRALEYPHTLEYAHQPVNHAEAPFDYHNSGSAALRHHKIAPSNFGHGENSMALQVYRPNMTYPQNRPYHDYGYGNFGYDDQLRPSYHVPYGAQGLSRYRPIYVVNGASPYWVPVGGYGYNGPWAPEQYYANDVHRRTSYHSYPYHTRSSSSSYTGPVSYF